MGKFEGKRLIRRPMCICQDNINIHDKEYDGMGWIGLLLCGAGAVGGLL